MQKAFLQCVVTMWIFKLLRHKKTFAQCLHLSAFSPKFVIMKHQPKLIRTTTTVVQGGADSLRAGGGGAGGGQGGARRLQPRDQGRARGQ